MTVVTERLNLPGGVNPRRVTVHVFLAGEDGLPLPAGYATVAGRTIVGEHQVIPVADGTWDIDLEPNDDITPTGTAWGFKLEGPVAALLSSTTRFGDVPASGPVELVDILTDPPGALIPPFVQTALDALTVRLAAVEADDAGDDTAIGAVAANLATEVSARAALAASLPGTYATLASVSNLADVGWDVIVLAGQSNMEGRAVADTVNYDVSDPRIFQYRGSGSMLGQATLAIEPLANPSGSIGLGHGTAFARIYLGAIPRTRRVLLVPTAYGGTGLGATNDYWYPGTTGHPAGSGFEFAIAQALAAVAAGGANSRVVGILWLQGENDNVTATATYQSVLDTLVDEFRSRLSAPTAWFLLGQMVPDYLSTNNRQAINDVHVDTPRRKLGTGFYYGPSGSTYNAGDGSHYNAAGQRTLGVNAVEAYRIALVNAVGTAPAAPTAPTVTQDDTTLTASWTRPISRVTDYLVEYKTSAASTWTTLVRAVNIDKTATITGITKGLTYNVRVSATNETGTSATVTASPIVTITEPGQVVGLAGGTATDTTQPLTWTATAGATSYKVEYKLAASGTWLTFATAPTSPSTTVTGLVGSNSYNYRVSARSAGGYGTVSATLTAATAAPTATATSLTSGATGTPTASVPLDTASITPLANQLIIAAVENKVNSGTPATPTLTGCGLTWVLVDTIVSSTFWRLSVYRAMGAAPTAGVVSIDCGATAQDQISHSIVQFTAMNTTGTNGSGAVGNHTTNSGTGTSLTVTLPAFGNVNNCTYGAVVQQGADAVSPGAGFSTIHSLSHSSANTKFLTEWKASNDTSVDVTWTTSLTASGIAVELVVA